MNIIIIKICMQKYSGSESNILTSTGSAEPKNVSEENSKKNMLFKVERRWVLES